MNESPHRPPAPRTSRITAREAQPVMKQPVMNQPVKKQPVETQPVKKTP